MDLLREGALERKVLETKRAEIAAKKSEINAVIHAEAADPDLLANCRKAVAEAIDRGFPAGFDELRRSNSLLKAMDFPGMRPYANTKLPDLSWGTLSQTLNSVGRLLGKGDDFAVQVVYETAKRRQGTAPGLPDVERQVRIRELHEELRKLERQEEQEVLRLEALGFNVLRREDIDPAVLFEVWSTYDLTIGSSRTEHAVPQVMDKRPKSPRSLSELARELNSGAVPSAAVGIVDLDEELKP
jgi:hypothetical protein